MGKKRKRQKRTLGGHHLSPPYTRIISSKVAVLGTLFGVIYKDTDKSAWVSEVRIKTTDTNVGYYFNVSAPDKHSHLITSPITEFLYVKTRIISINPIVFEDLTLWLGLDSHYRKNFARTRVGDYTVTRAFNEGNFGESMNKLARQHKQFQQTAYAIREFGLNNFFGHNTYGIKSKITELARTEQECGEIVKIVENLTGKVLTEKDDEDYWLPPSPYNEEP